eukprot:5238156-Amphidinium_carterae.1
MDKASAYITSVQQPQLARFNRVSMAHVLHPTEGRMRLPRHPSAIPVQCSFCLHYVGKKNVSKLRFQVKLVFKKLSYGYDLVFLRSCENLVSLHGGNFVGRCAAWSVGGLPPVTGRGPLPTPPTEPASGYPRGKPQYVRQQNAPP